MTAVFSLLKLDHIWSLQFLLWWNICFWQACTKQLPLFPTRNQTRICSASNSALMLKRLPRFRQLEGNKETNPFFFLCSPLVDMQTNLCHTVLALGLSQETGLQLNLQQQAEVFPLGFSQCQRHVPQFLHCSSLWFPVICQKLCTLFLCFSCL